jgi:type IX secretion system PorP/SprF family membrane protein
MKNLLLLLATVFVFQASAQNDPLYGQYLFNQAMINPAYSGIHNVVNATLLSRAQWAGIDGAPLTNTLSVSSSFMQDKLGGGLLLINDRLGINTTTEISASFNYKIKFENSKLSYGLQGGVVNYWYDYSKLNLEVVDQKITQPTENFSKPTIGAGIFYMHDKFYAGISIPRFMDVTVQDGVSSSTRYKRHIYLSGGYIFDKNEKLKIKPSVLVRMVENTSTSVDFNLQVLLAEVLWTGVMTRNFNSIGLNSQLELKNKLRVGYLFELPTNKLSANSFGTHEIMVSIDLEFFERQVALRRYF